MKTVQCQAKDAVEYVESRNSYYVLCGLSTASDALILVDNRHVKASTAKFANSTAASMAIDMIEGCGHVKEGIVTMRESEMYSDQNRDNWIINFNDSLSTHKNNKEWSL